MLTTVGHDSEFGLKAKGMIHSALDVIKPFENKSGRCFPDNLNCEIAINPVTDLKTFHSYTEDLLNHVRNLGYEVITEPVIIYPDKTLKHPDAFLSGCNPDYSGYTEKENIAPDFKNMDGTRSLGGHIHVGDNIDPYNFARWMDLFVGLPMMLLEPINNRRSMYGGAGCLRVKPYGAEYRTLSNIWLDSTERREFVWENTMKAINYCKMADSRASLEHWVDIPKAIDTHDIKLAQEVINRSYNLGVTNICL